MEIRGQTIPPLVLIAIIGLIVAAILHVIGMATPNWEETYTSYQTAEKLLAYSGLWIQCNLLGRTTIDVFLEDDAFHCEPHIEVKGYVLVVRGLCVIGFICGVLAIIFVALFLFLDNDKIKGIFKITGILFCFLSGMFVMIGVIVYGVNIDEERVDEIMGRTDSLSWSFGLCVTSSVICIICAALATIGVAKR